MSADSPSRPLPHEVEWTLKKIERFWDWWGDYLGEEAFFSRDHGWAILDIVERSVPLAGKRVVDIGTGPGFLIDELLRRGAECSGVELSPELTAVANERLARRSGFGGVTKGSVSQLPIPDASVDVACCLEVVEHLLDNQLNELLGELVRVVRPGGHVVISTPNEENFDHYRTICPDCGALFHRIQHVRRWTADTMVDRTRAAGLEPERVVRTVLGRNRAHALASRQKLRFQRALGASAAPLPQLVYVGRRR